MENFLLYLIKATVCLIAFSVFFRLLLMKETFFRFTRMTLLLGLVACSVLPFVKLKTGKTYAFQQPVSRLEEFFVSEKIPVSEKEAEIQVENAVFSPHNQTPAQPPVPDVKTATPFDWFSLLSVVYWLGVVVMLSRFAVSFISLRQLVKASRVIRCDEYRLIVSREDVVPFSFFRYIVLSEKDYRENPDEIILHEKMHAAKKHNLDVIFSELFLAAHWFNPAVWLLCRDLREIHEYEADNAVIYAGIEAQKYQLLLVKKAVGERRFTSVVNSFNQSKIKNRITMMLKKESIAWARLKVLFVVPLAAALLLAFAQPEVAEDRIIDYQSRKNAADFFLSIPKEQKENHSAYLYLNANDFLFLMQKNRENALMKTVDMKQEPDLVETFSNLMSQKDFETEYMPIHFVLGAEDDTQMSSVTSVKNAMRKAYEITCGMLAKEKNSSVETIKKKYPLTMTYTSVQAVDPESIVKQVQSNPAFYWEQVRKYCKEKNIEPKNLNFQTSKENSNLIVVLINFVNQIMYQSAFSTDWLKTQEEAESDLSVRKLKDMIVQVIDKNKDAPVYFSLQNDVSTSTGFIVRFINYTLPSAYESALKEVSERDAISFDKLKENKPLLLVYTMPKNFSVNKENTWAKDKSKKNSAVFYIRVSSVKNNKTEVSLYSGLRVDEGSNAKGNHIESVALKVDTLLRNDLIIEERVPAKNPNHIDVALVTLEEGARESDVIGIQRMLSGDRFKVKEAYFLFGFDN